MVEFHIPGPDTELTRKQRRWIVFSVVVAIFILSIPGFAVALICGKEKCVHHVRQVHANVQGLQIQGLK